MRRYAFAALARASPRGPAALNTIPVLPRPSPSPSPSPPPSLRRFFSAQADQEAPKNKENSKDNKDKDTDTGKDTGKDTDTGTGENEEEALRKATQEAERHAREYQAKRRRLVWLAMGGIATLLIATQTILSYKSSEAVLKQLDFEGMEDVSDILLALDLLAIPSSSPVSWELVEESRPLIFAASCLTHPEPLVQERAAVVLTKMCRQNEKLKKAVFDIVPTDHLLDAVLSRFHRRGWIDEDAPLHNLLGELLVAKSVSKKAAENDYPLILATMLQTGSLPARKAALTALKFMSSHDEVQEAVLAHVPLELVACEVWPDLTPQSQSQPQSREPLPVESILDAKEILHNIYCGPCFKKFDSLHQKLVSLQNYSRSSDEWTSIGRDLVYYAGYGGFLGAIWGIVRAGFGRRVNPGNLFSQHGLRNALGAAYFAVLFQANEHFDQKYMQDVAYPTYLSYSAMSTAALIACLYSISRWAPYTVLPSILTSVAINLNRYKNFDESELPASLAAAVKAQKDQK